nr:PRA1 family protein B3-like [Ipomoea batatas]GMD66348.1 PRA1 family protein B3-like [Ipomoea batatas]GMD68549.1 PRA1 family protein B3-like [Ipomoea batatas]
MAMILSPLLISLVLIFLTSVGLLLMPAILIGFGIIACIHDAFRDPEYLPLDDHELNGFGLFSFISGTGSMTFASIPGVPPDVSESDR